MAKNGAKKGDIFGRSDAKPSRRTAKERSLREAVSKLCGNADFRFWLYRTLDDLSKFSRDEGMLTDFGQGIRAAAAHVQNGLLASPEAVDALAEMYRRNLKAEHEGIVKAEKEKNEE